MKLTEVASGDRSLGCAFQIFVADCIHKRGVDPAHGKGPPSFQNMAVLSAFLQFAVSCDERKKIALLESRYSISHVAAQRSDDCLQTGKD